VRKVDGIERVIPAEETMRRVASIAAAMGVTRLADITGLDRVGIPVYSSVVPDSNDDLSVYNGKGTRRIDAQAGAVMEALERQTALRARPPCIEGTYADLSKNRMVLDPKSINQELSPRYSENSVYSWIEGVEIHSGEPCLVPAKLAGYLWREFPHPSCFLINDTTGIAAGNCREEAICHALCELAERDAWTMAEIGAHQLPQRRSLALGLHAKDGPDDLEMFPCLDLGPNDLLERFHQAGLFPIVHDITSDLGVPTVFASVTDEHISGFPMAHSGIGCHPDMQVAVRRALTELAQSRCVDIQAVREDIQSPDAPADSFSLHTRRIRAIDRNSWYFGQSRRRRPLAEAVSYPHSTIEEDLDFLFHRFRGNGLRTIIVVDFTPPQGCYSVVRVIVPGVELWATDHGRIGPRALAFWKRNA
jgi:ribosomal protein S12 methylthiotransferase accessory factor